jgi:hypothetical protein
MENKELLNRKEELLEELSLLSQENEVFFNSCTLEDAELCLLNKKIAILELKKDIIEYENGEKNPHEADLSYYQVNLESAKQSLEEEQHKQTDMAMDYEEKISTAKDNSRAKRKQSVLLLIFSVVLLVLSFIVSFKLRF